MRRTRPPLSRSSWSCLARGRTKRLRRVTSSCERGGAPGAKAKTTARTPESTKRTKRTKHTTRAQSIDRGGGGRKPERSHRRRAGHGGRGRRRRDARVLDQRQRARGGARDDGVVPVRL